MEKNYENPPAEREKSIVLSEEEEVMRDLLKEAYKARGASLMAMSADMAEWRQKHPDATFGDAIRALYQKLEEEK
ncbi:MAG: hypothetical protein Q7S28_02145 [bacterium]|nr:hypothetical protein [bacterium]